MRVMIAVLLLALPAQAEEISYSSDATQVCLENAMGVERVQPRYFSTEDQRRELERVQQQDQPQNRARAEREKRVFRVHAAPPIAPLYRHCSGTANNWRPKNSSRHKITKIIRVVLLCCVTVDRARFTDRTILRCGVGLKRMEARWRWITIP